MNWIWWVVIGVIILILFVQAWGSYLRMRNLAEELEDERNEALAMLRLVILDDPESPGMDEDYIAELRRRVENEKIDSVLELFYKPKKGKS